MLQFRILGPLEVIGPNGLVDLGGQRQRALLAILLLHAGRVVPSERLIDDLWGARPPKTAPTSLQNAVSQLRKALGSDVVETKPRGYRLAVAPDHIDAGRFEQLLEAARGDGAALRRRRLVEALALWRGPPLAEFGFEAFAAPEANRLEELRLVAVEERIDAELELGLHAEVIGELEGLVAANPLRERPRAQLMLALYRSGRQAEALQRYQETRRVLVDELGIEPGRTLQQLQAAILRHDTAIGTPSPNGEAGDREAEVVAALASGRLVIVLGLAGAAEVAAHLASAFDYPPDRSLDLLRVSQYVATMRGSGPLYDELHALFETAAQPTEVHTFLAALPAALREHASPYPLLVTTNFDLALERAFDDAGEDLDVVAYVAAGRHRGKFWHRAPGEQPRPVELPNEYATELSLERRPVLLKLSGAVDPHPERAWESFAVTEDDFIDYLGHSELGSAVPVGLAARLRRSHFLFLGYEMVDWNVRLVLGRIWGERPLGYRSWAVQPHPTALEHAFWRTREVDVVDAEPAAYVHLLARRLAG